MSGFLSKVFEPEGSGGAQQQQLAGDQNAAQSDAGYSEASAHSSDQSADADAGGGVEVTVPIHLETGVDYQTEDGSGGWNNSTDATLTVSTAAILGASEDASFGDEAAVSS